MEDNQDTTINYDNLPIRTEEVNEVLARSPKWLLRWGTLMFVLGMGAFLCFLYWFKYPERVITDVSLTTSLPPVVVLSPTSGYLSEIVVSEGDTIRKGKEIAQIGNGADYNDLLELEAQIGGLATYGEEALQVFMPNLQWDLGALKSYYEQVDRAHHRYMSFKNSLGDPSSLSNIAQQKGIINEKIKDLKEQIKEYDRPLKRAIKERDLTKKRVEAGERSGNDLSKAEQNIADVENDIKDKKRELKEEERNLKALSAQRINISQSGDEKELESFQDLKAAVSDLEREIDRWKKSFLIHAPTSGATYFGDYRVEGQYVAKGDTIMEILPFQKANDYIGQLYIPVQGAGRVEEGQKVQIKFNDYPFLDYGLSMTNVRLSDFLIGFN